MPQMMTPISRQFDEPPLGRRGMEVTILMGSSSDMPVVKKCTAVLDRFGVAYQVRVASAHRSPTFVESIVKDAIASDCKIFIACAGLAAALPGAVAAMTTKPVIGIPVGGKVPLDSLLSIVQMPPGMPVACVGVDRGDNAAVLAVQMLALGDEELAVRFSAWRAARTAGVIADDESLREE